MKKIISILAFTSLLCCSCDYLDVVPEGKATEEDIWKTTEQADKFRYYLQTYMPNLIGYDWSPDQFAGDDFITGARGTTYYFSSKSLLYNEETSSNTYFGRWEPSSVSGGTNYDIYRGIRYCYYMLDNVYKVPVISPENADRYAGEAWFLIGYYHQCLLEYYGPVIVVKKFIPIDAPEEEIFVPRTPYDDCVKFIADCYDKAAGLLPETVVPAELGMPTKMAALSYKARLLLYAASPLVNGNPDYIGFNNPDGTPLMSTTYDPEKWKRALDAAAAAIALADEINPDTKKPKYDLYTSADSSLPDDERGRKNYHDTFVEEPWNGAEFILAKGAQSGIQALQRYGGPRSIKGNMSKGWKTTLVPTMEAVEMYYTKNGLPLDVDPLTKDEDLYDKTIEDVFDDEVFNSTFWLYWRTMFAFENWHSALEMKLYFQRFIHHISGLPDFSALKFTKYNQYESLILPMKKYLEAAGVDFQFNTEVTNVIFDINDGKKVAKAIECKVKGVEKGIVLTENDLVFVTNGSCTEGTIYGDQNHAPNGDAEVRTSGVWSLWKNIAKQDPSFGHPEKFCSDVSKTNWESATVTTLDDKIIPYITNICKRDPRSGKVVTGGIVSCQDSKWLLSWTINRQGQFKEQDKNQVCVWVYGLFTDVPGDYIKKPMKDCTGKEITEEWLYHLGVPVEDIEDLAEHSAVCVPTMMPYITAFFMPRTKGDRPDVIPDGCVNFAFLGQFAETPRDTVFTTEYSVRTAMEAVYGLLGVDRGVPEVWGSVYDVRELLDSSVKLMDGMSPLEIELPGPLNALKKPLLRVVKGTVVEKLLRDHNVIKDGMLD